jgi:hypothetical protein
VFKIAKNGLFRHIRDILGSIFSKTEEKKSTFKKNLLLPVNLIYRLVQHAILKIYCKSCSRDYELLFQSLFRDFYVAIKSLSGPEKRLSGL